MFVPQTFDKEGQSHRDITTGLQKRTWDMGNKSSRLGKLFVWRATVFHSAVSFVAGVQPACTAIVPPLTHTQIVVIVANVPHKANKAELLLHLNRQFSLTSVCESGRGFTSGPAPNGGPQPGLHGGKLAQLAIGWR